MTDEAQLTADDRALVAICVTLLETGLVTPDALAGNVIGRGRHNGDAILKLATKLGVAARAKIAAEPGEPLTEVSAVNVAAYLRAMNVTSPETVKTWLLANFGPGAGHLTELVERLADKRRGPDAHAWHTSNPNTENTHV